MTKRRREEPPKRVPTKRQLSRWQKERRWQRIIIISALATIAVILGVPLFGYFYESRIVPFHEDAIKVNETVFDWGYFVKFYRAWAASQNMSSAPTFDSFSRGLEALRDGEILRQEKPDGVTAPAEEVDQKLRELGMGDQLAKKEYRTLAEGLVLRESLKQKLGEKVPTSGEQVHVYAIKTNDPEKAQLANLRLLAGEDFLAVAKDISEELEPGLKGGDLGWLPKGVRSLLVKDQVYIWGIRVKNVEKATEARARIEGGETFSQVAKQLSPDETLIEDWIVPGMSPKIFGKEFDSAVFALEPDTLSEPIETPNGYWVVKVLEKVPGGEVFDEFAFNLNIGVVSPPLITTQGVYYLKVVEKATDREFDKEDREKLMDNAVEGWLKEKQSNISWEWIGVDQNRFEWFSSQLGG